MLQQSPTYPHEPILPGYLDSSMLTSFKACPYKFYQEYICRRAPTLTSIHLIAGGALAKFLEVFRLEYYGNKLSKPDAILRGIDAFLGAWPADNPYEHHAKNIYNVGAACLEYLKEYDPDTDVVQPVKLSDGKPAVEFSFAIPTQTLHPLTGQPIIYCGRYDMLGEMARQVYVVDEKTTSSFGASWARQWNLRYQFLGYTWATREMGYKAAGALVRGIGFMKSGVKFMDAPIQIPHDRLDRWHQQMERDVAEVVRCWNEGVWGQDFSASCTLYGECTFYDVCMSSNPDAWLSQFVERTWNPLDPK